VEAAAAMPMPPRPMPMAVRLAVVADTVRAYLDVTTSAQRVKVAQERWRCSTSRSASPARASMWAGPTGST
jgi:hypothetical protein